MNQKQAVDWLNAQVGQYRDFDGQWYAQCVDLFNFYYQTLVGVSPYSHGYGVPGAKDLWNVPTDLFTKIPDSPSLVPQAGDVLIYGSTWGGGYGHVEMVSNVDSNGCTVVGNNLNGNPRLPVQKTYRTWAQMRGLIGVMRFVRFNSNQGDESMAIKNPEFIKNMYRYVGGREATQAEVNVHMQGTPESLLNGFIGGGDLEVVRLRQQLDSVKQALANEQAKPPKEVIKEVEKVVTEYVDRPVEVIKEVEPGWLVSFRDAILTFLRLKK